MSAVASLPTRSSSPGTGVPLTTLVGVELRKMTDTRAGRWLLVGVGLATALVLGVALGTGDAGTRSFTNLFSLAQLPMSILLPVLGVLAATSEWSQRTVLTTFALVPSRKRVLTAKFGAAVILAGAATVFALVVAAAFALIAPAVGATDADWGLGLSDLGQAIVYLQLNMLLGLALGTLLLNSALAIVLYFVLPTVWAGAVDAFSLDTLQQWLDTATTWMRLVAEDPMTGEGWGQVGASAVLWILVPLGIGTVRVLRREVD